jgi:hypothetical protein
MMTKINEYTIPAIDAIEVEVESGFSLSGVEAPDFDNENIL